MTKIITKFYIFLIFFFTSNYFFFLILGGPWPTPVPLPPSLTVSQQELQTLKAIRHKAGPT
jgi:hypothetical protein